MKDLKSAKPDLPVPLILFKKKKKLQFLFLCRSCWFARTYLSMRRAVEKKVMNLKEKQSKLTAQSEMRVQQSKGPDPSWRIRIQQLLGAVAWSGQFNRSNVNYCNLYYFLAMFILTCAIFQHVAFVWSLGCFCFFQFRSVLCGSVFLQPAYFAHELLIQLLSLGLVRQM